MKNIKKSNFYRGNIVKRISREYPTAITYILPTEAENEIEIVKENAILFKFNGKYVDVDDIESNFDLFCANFFKKHVKLDYFEYLTDKPNSRDYVDPYSLKSLYPQLEQDNDITIGKVKKLSIHNTNK